MIGRSVGGLAVVVLVALCAACSSAAPNNAAAPPVDEVAVAQTIATADPVDEPVVVAGNNSSDMFRVIEDLMSPTIPTLRGVVPANGDPDLNIALGPNEPYRIGGLVTETIASIPIAPGTCDGAEARLAGASQRGELDRPIEWLGCIDDGGDENRYQSGLDRLLFAKPFALVPLTSQHFLSGEALSREGVIHAGIGEQPAYCGLDNRFGFAVSGAAGCPVLAVSGLTTSGPVLRAWLEASGRVAQSLQVAVVVDASRSGAETLGARSLEVSAVGATLALADQRLLPGPGNPVSALNGLAQDVIKADVDVVVVEVDDAPRLYEALRSGGFEGDIVGTNLDPSLISSSAELRAQYRDTWQVTQGVSLLSDGGGGWQRLTQDAGLIGPTGTIGQGFVRGYVAMDFLIAALRAPGEEPMSPAAVHDAINRGWSYPGVPGLACPSAWPVAHLVAAPCASVVRAEVNDSLRLALPPTVFELLVDSDR